MGIVQLLILYIQKCCWILSVYNIYYWQLRVKTQGDSIAAVAVIGGGSSSRAVKGSNSRADFRE